MDLEKIRSETPRAGELIHFNSAGSSLMPQPVYDAIHDYQLEEWKNGGYETYDARQEELRTFYEYGAKLLNVNPDELAYTDSATTSWQRAFFSIPWKDGDEIITANTEYASNYISFLRLKKFVDVTVRVARDNEAGEVDVEHLSELINNNTRLIAITHMPTMGGVVNPIEEVGNVAREKGILYMVDACQSVGQYPLDIEKIGCQILSGTGRKYLRGPRGTGLLYVSSDLLPDLDPLSIDLYSGQWMPNQEYRMRKNSLRFETYESNYAAKAGLAAALGYQLSLGIEHTWSRIQSLAANFRNKLMEIGGLSVHDTGSVLSGIVTLTIEGKSAAEIHDGLSKRNINTSYAFTANSRLYMEKKGLDEVLRASVHYYNTEDEVDEVVGALNEISKE